MKAYLTLLILALPLWSQNITPGREPGHLDFWDPALKPHNLRQYLGKAVVLALIPEKDYSRNRLEGLGLIQQRYAREGVQVLAAVLSAKPGLLERMREAGFPYEIPVGPVTMEECKTFLGKDCDATSPHLIQFDRAGKLRDDQPFVVDQPDGLLISTLWTPPGLAAPLTGGATVPAVSAKAQEFFRQLVSSELISPAKLLASVKGLNVEAPPDFAISAQRGILDANLQIDGESPLKLKVALFQDGGVYRTDTLVKQGGLVPHETTVKGEAHRVELAVIHVDLTIQGFCIRESRDVGLGEFRVFSQRTILAADGISDERFREVVQLAVTKVLSDARAAPPPPQSAGAWRQIVGDASRAEELWKNFAAARPGGLLKGLTTARKVTGFSPASVTRSGVEGAPDWIDDEVNTGRTLPNGMGLNAKLHVVELRFEDAFIRLGSRLYRTPGIGYRLVDAAYLPMADVIDNFARETRTTLAKLQLRMHKQLDLDFPK